MTRTPDEIKKGLEYLSIKDIVKKLDMWKEGIAYDYAEDAAADALALIRQLQAENAEQADLIEYLKTEIEEYEEAADKCCYEFQCNARLNKLEALCKRLRDENEQLEAERDALLKYITDSSWAACDICKYGIDGASVMDCKHIREVGVPCFEWRGLQKEE